MTKRSIGMMVLLTIVTFGIYGLYWSFKTQEDIRKFNQEGFEPGVHLLLCLFTCGIYQLYWAFKIGYWLSGFGVKDNGLIYLLIDLFVGSGISSFFIQDQINKLPSEAIHVVK